MVIESRGRKLNHHLKKTVFFLYTLSSPLQPGEANRPEYGLHIFDSFQAKKNFLKINETKNVTELLQGMDELLR
jgi:hypothetical protein